MAESEGKRSDAGKWKKSGHDLFIEIVGWVLTTALTAGIGVIFAQQPIAQLFYNPSFWFHIVVVALLGWGLIYFMRRTKALKKELVNSQEKEQFNNSKLTKFNIQHIYLNREACDAIIQEKVKSSASIKFFLLLGSDFSGKSSAYLPAFHAKTTSNAKVQILISAEDSPFLSENRLKSIKKDKADIRSILNNVKTELNKLKKKLKNKGIVLNWQEHKETILCKFHLFDDCVVFCFNIITSDNDKVSPHFLVQKSEATSIYNAFEMYFDFVWNRSVKPRNNHNL